MRPGYSALKANHYSSTPGNDNYRTGNAVFSEIGIDLAALMKDNRAYENTCAVRMSIALLKCKVVFEGRMKIKSGAFKGLKIEPGAKLLADALSKSTFGKPKYLSPATAPKEIGTKKGLVFFDRVIGYGGGHIDLIEPQSNTQVCHSDCYFVCKEVWFWELA